METTGDVSFRPVSEEDLPHLFRWWNDPVVMREVGAEKFKPSLEDLCSKYWPRWREPGPYDHHEFIICLEGEPIGEIGYNFIEKEEGVAEVDIKICRPELWGQKLGTRAMGSFLRFLFDELELQAVRADVLSTNARSLGLVRKFGFTLAQEHQVDATAIHDGGRAIVMELTKAAHQRLGEPS
jgi:RimJ/RimL family protein N-acetyltransferase